MAEEPTTPPSPVTWEEGNSMNDDDHFKGVATESASSIPLASMAEDLQRTVMQSRDSAIRSARSLRHNLPEYMEKAVSGFRTYEHAFFHKIKGNNQSPTRIRCKTLSNFANQRIDFVFVCEICICCRRIDECNREPSLNCWNWSHCCLPCFARSLFYLLLTHMTRFHIHLLRLLYCLH